MRALRRLTLVQVEGEREVDDDVDQEHVDSCDGRVAVHLLRDGAEVDALPVILQDQVGFCCVGDSDLGRDGRGSLLSGSEVLLVLQEAKAELLQQEEEHRGNVPDLRAREKHRDEQALPDQRPGEQHVHQQNQEVARVTEHRRLQKQRHNNTRDQVNDQVEVDP